MKLERLPEHLTTAVVTLLGILFAIYCARMSSLGQIKIIATFGVGIVLIFVALTARTRAWMFIPATWMLLGQIPALPIPFAARDLVILSVCGMFMAFTALKIVRVKPAFTFLDFLLLINLIWIVSVYIRNPVGTYAMGSERVGGRPYFIIFVSTLAYWVLKKVSVTETQARRLPIYMLCGTTISGFFASITYYFPSTVPFFSQFYTGITTEIYDSEAGIGASTLVEGRQNHLANVGQGYVEGLCSYLRPLTLLNPLFIGRFVLFLFALYGLLISGHRSFVLNSALIFLVCSYFRSGLSDVIRLCAFGLPALAVLIGMQGNLIHLPLAAQRALSFLPGNWDYEAVADAKGSTEWRQEMWKLALTTDKYIENKWLGDGFGFTAREIETMMRMNATANQQGIQENMMISGAFHSGPISSIRYAGIVGLFLYLSVAFYLAWFSWKLIRRAENTAFFPLALFIGVPLIIDPFSFIVIFGSYDSAIPNAFFFGGMLRMLERSLDEADRTLDMQRGGTPSGRRYVSPRFEKPIRVPVSSRAQLNQSA